MSPIQTMGPIRTVRPSWSPIQIVSLIQTMGRIRTVSPIWTVSPLVVCAPDSQHVWMVLWFKCQS